MPTSGFLSHLDLNVSNTAVSIPFYDVLLRSLGFDRTVAVQPDRACWQLISPDGSHFEIEVRPSRGSPASKRHVRSDPGIDHLAFHAESAADVDSIFEQLTRRGYVVDEPPRNYDYSPGYYAVGFDDPDGVRLEIAFDPNANP